MAFIFLFLSPRSIPLFEKIRISFGNIFPNQFKILRLNLGLNLHIQTNFEKFQI
jgi:hypothetical protein